MQTTNTSRFKHRAHDHLNMHEQNEKTEGGLPSVPWDQT